MQKKRKQSLEILNENTAEILESNIETLKYIKRLELQISVLNKLIGVDLNTTNINDKSNSEILIIQKK
jgi:hypothetical protein